MGCNRLRYAAMSRHAGRDPVRITAPELRKVTTVELAFSALIPSTPSIWFSSLPAPSYPARYPACYPARNISRIFYE